MIPRDYETGLLPKTTTPTTGIIQSTTGPLPIGTSQAPLTSLQTSMQQPSPLTSLLEKDYQTGTLTRGTAPPTADQSTMLRQMLESMKTAPTGTDTGITAPSSTGYGDIGYTPGGYTERQKFLGEGSMLPKFGYGGELGINPYETQALDYITKMAEARQPLQTTMPAESFYREALAGEYSPLGDLFRKGVYETTEAGAMETLEKLQKGMSERFAHRGGYFGGEHAISQAELARGTGTDLNQILANLMLSGYGEDIATKMGAARGIESLAGTQRLLEKGPLEDIMAGGQMLTGRELLNRELYQQATDRAYQDWLRAQQERMVPYNLISTLLGVPATQPMVTQPQASPWAGLLGGIGTGLGAAGGAALLSSKQFKKDISEISDEDEKRIFEKLVSTPLFRYRYKFENNEVIPHLGLITESSPKELTLFDDKAIGIAEYISALHAAVKVMSKKIEKLEGKE